MKTTKEWIDICKKSHPLIGDEWENKLLSQDNLYDNNKKFNSMSDALFLYSASKYGFIWSESPQDHKYWSDIHKDMVENPNKYAAKRKLFNPS